MSTNEDSAGAGCARPAELALAGNGKNEMDNAKNTIHAAGQWTLLNQPFIFEAVLPATACLRLRIPTIAEYTALN